MPYSDSRRFVSARSEARQGEGVCASGHTSGNKQQREVGAERMEERGGELLQGRVIGDEVIVIEAEEPGLPVHGVQHRLQDDRGGRRILALQDRPQILVARPGQKGGQLPGEVFDAFAGAEGVPENLLGR